MKWMLWNACLLGVAYCAVAQDSEPAKIRVLLTYGGHGFQEGPFFEMFDRLPGIVYTRAPMPESADRLKPGLENEVDVIVMYDMAPAISAGQQQAFVALLNKGIGVVALHHNLAAHPGWDEYRKIIGGKYLLEPRTLEGREYRASTYAHDLDLEVHIADPDHPITRGLEDFQIHDEGYQYFYTSPEATVLLTCDHPRSDRNLAWVTRFGSSPVFYLLLGHDAQAWGNPAYPRLLSNGIRWAASRGQER